MHSPNSDSRSIPVDPVDQEALFSTLGTSRLPQSLNGTKALMAGVLEDALQCYLGYNAKLRRDAEHWVDSGQEWIFSFVSVCEALGLDPEATRRAFAALRRRTETPAAQLWSPLRWGASATTLTSSSNRTPLDLGHRPEAIHQTA